MFMESSHPWEIKYEASVAIFAALAHPIRISIAHCLVNKPRTVRELTEQLQVSQPLVSHHLRILRDAHVVEKTQQGRSSLYNLTDHHISHIVTDVHEHTHSEEHAHTHGPDCGHKAVIHLDHVDYLHDGHAHREHEGHYDECNTCSCGDCNDLCATCDCANCTCETCNHAQCQCGDCSDACANCVCENCACPTCEHAA